MYIGINLFAKPPILRIRYKLISISKILVLRTKLVFLKKLKRRLKKMSQIKTLYVSVFQSKRGNKTFALVADLGYTRKFLSFDVQTIAEVLGIPVVELYDMQLGAYDLLKGE